jgi:uncharacterized RDD family membrane protein YckC
MKLKITNLTEEKEFFKTERDAYGNRTREPYTATIKRKVNVISGGPRFGHYLIDLVIMYGINFAFGFIMGVTAPEAVLNMPDVVWYLFGWMITVLYYFIMESTTQRTVGKLVTDSVVIDEYGNKPDTMTLLGRSFARIIPFEAFSCLGERGWHDTLSKTYVVTKQEEATLKRLLSEQEGVPHVDNRADLLD